MKLVRAQVTNFHSIVDSGVVDVQNNVTVLIGKNEQGKSNFLKALFSFNENKTFSAADFPSHKRVELESSKPNTIPVINLWFSISRNEFKSITGDEQAGEKVKEIKATKYFDGSYKYFWITEDGTENDLEVSIPNIDEERTKISETASRLLAKLESYFVRLPEYAVNQDQIKQIVQNFVSADFNDESQLDDVYKAFITALTSVPGQDEEVKNDITSFDTALQGIINNLKDKLQKPDVEPLRKTMPRFVYHSTRMHEIPNEVPIAEFIENPDQVSRGMHNLCTAAGLSLQKIKDLAATQDTAQVSSHEDHYKTVIEGGINEFWTQQEYQVHFQIRQNKLSVFISDGTYALRIPPKERSEGFQWYLSFYCVMQNDISEKLKTIILLDNPGLELHVDGQLNIRSMLEEKISAKNQVIYVTHSPALVNPNNLGQIRKVELLGGNKGTVISKDIFKSGDNLDLLEPVRMAIGASLVASLVHSDNNILVEGAADKPILEGILAHRYSDLVDRVLITGGLAESKDGFIAKFFSRSKLPYSVLLDADSSGREIKKTLTSNGIPESTIVMLSDVIKSRKDDFDLEDLISPPDYHKAVLRTYPELKMEQPEEIKGKITKVYENIFPTELGFGFNKKRVGEELKQIITEGKAEEDTIDNLMAVMDVLLQKMRITHEANTTEAEVKVNKKSKAQLPESKLPSNDKEVEDAS